MSFSESLFITLLYISMNLYQFSSLAFNKLLDLLLIKNEVSNSSFDTINSRPTTNIVVNCKKSTFNNILVTAEF